VNGAITEEQFRGASCLQYSTAGQGGWTVIEVRHFRKIDAGA
jgi:hypothetical protein